MTPSPLISCFPPFCVNRGAPPMTSWTLRNPTRFTLVFCESFVYGVERRGFFLGCVRFGSSVTQSRVTPA